MTRALLLFNPKASKVSPRLQDVITRALASELKLEVAQTKRRHHATHIVRGAAHEGIELVVVLGGDGTLNEVVNGLAGTDVAVSVIPGGGTNVFARTHGVPKDPIEATAALLEKIQQGVRPRKINLGNVNGRAFAFCAGIGFDAAVVHAVERRFRMKRSIGESYFIYQAVRTFFFSPPKRNARISVVREEETLDARGVAIVCNSDPYTFWGDRELHLCPQADPQKGLDVTTLTRFGSPTVLRAAAGAFRQGRHLRMRSVRALHDLSAFQIRCEQPTPYQVDGDHAGEGTMFNFSLMPAALSVLS